MANKKEYIILGGIIAVIVAVFVLIGIKYGGNNGAGKLILPINAVVMSDQIKGDKEAKNVLIEYSDFQCPACGFYAPIAKRVIEEFSAAGGDKIIFAYRHFPLSQHKNAELVAISAEAAGRQGKFWEMHDKIFENQQEWSENNNARDLFIKYAESISLDIEQFKADIDLKELKGKVKNDLQSGLAAGVNSTPTFYLNGRRIQPRGYDDFKAEIEKLRQK